MIWLSAIFASQRSRNIALYVGGFLVIAVVAWGFYMTARSFVRHQREEAVQIDRQDTTLEAANRVIEADREATQNQVVRDVPFREAQEELRYEVREKGTTDNVGSGTSAVIERLRKQQAEGRR